MNRFLYIAFILFFTFSCDKEDNGVKRQIDNQGVVVATPCLWKKSLHENEPASNSYIKNPIIYNDNILVPTTNGEDRSLSLIDSKNGKTLWRWGDTFKEYSTYIDVSYYYQHNNLLVFQDGSSGYCLNMDDGITYWKYKWNSSFFTYMSGVDETFFIQGNEISPSHEYYAHILFRGDVQTGEIKEFVTPNFVFSVAPGDRIGDVTAALYIELEQVPYLAVIWQEPVDYWKWQTYLGLYNYQSNGWVYEKQVMNIPANNGVLFPPPTIFNNKIYANISCGIVCHDLATGKQLWRKEFTNDFMFSGFIIEDGRLIANNEDLFTYCLDPETGNILWQTKTAGTCSRISYLNGIVYFAGGSDTKLFGVEASTGKIVWRINPTLLGEPYGAQFKYNAVYVLPAKDGQPAKVIALTNLNAYCFEAYR